MKKIDLHLIDLSLIDIEKLYSSPFINDEDILKTQRFKVDQVRNEKLSSIYLKRKYIGQYQISDRGKPLSEDCYFNISHSGGVTILAIDKSNLIGVDIEYIKKVEDDFVRHVCDDKEYKFIKNNEDFYKIWTNKESLLKAIGTGIDKRLNEVIGLPLNSIREYEGNLYRSKTIKYQDYIITITTKSLEEFDIDVIIENN